VERDAVRQGAGAGVTHRPRPGTASGTPRRNCQHGRRAPSV